MSMPPPFRDVASPDEQTQYDEARRFVATHGVPIPDPLAMTNTGTGWLIFSVWRLSLFGSGDDLLTSRRGNGNQSSLIVDELLSWEQWLHYRVQANSAEPDQSKPLSMVSIPLLESTVEYAQTVFKQRFPLRNFQKIGFVRAEFEAMSDRVDSISPDLGNGHLIWVYEDGALRGTAIHGGGDASPENLQRLIELSVHT